MGWRPTSSPAAAGDGLRKGAWNVEEDIKLVAYITKYGSWNWRQLPKFAGLNRCGKSCRLRWMNYLNPYIKRGNYTKEEEDTIIRLHESLGNKWSLIAAQLPGRTDNEIKNHWHGKLKKMLKKAPSFTNIPKITSNSDNDEVGRMRTSSSPSVLVIGNMPTGDSTSSNLKGLGEEIYSVGGDLGKDQFVVDSGYNHVGLNDDYFLYAESFAAAADFGYEGFLTFPSSYDVPIAREDEFFVPLWL